MGFLKIKQPLLESGRAVAPVQSLTAASTGTAVSAAGVTIISSSASKMFRLATPARSGQVKEVIFRTTLTAAKIRLIAGNTTAATYWNSTKGSILSSSVQHAQIPASVRLISVSTGTSFKWSVLSHTTGCVISS